MRVRSSLQHLPKINQSSNDVKECNTSGTSLGHKGCENFVNTKTQNMTLINHTLLSKSGNNLR